MRARRLLCFLPTRSTRPRSLTSAVLRRFSWQSLGLREEVCSAASASWPEPNVVQSAAIAPLLQGKDCVVGAETGSGKTLAYLLPAMHLLLEETHDRRLFPRVMILVPNRELATQARRVAAQLGFQVEAPYDSALSLAARHGKAGIWPYRPGQCPRALVATPSFADGFHRDLDLWESLDLLVLDEADALLDGSSKEQLDRILVALKRVERRREKTKDLFSSEEEEEEEDVGPPLKRCQRVVVAATLPSYGLKSVEALVDKHFAGAERVVGADGAPLPIHAAVPALRQTYVKVQGPEDRSRRLLESLDPSERTMVFANTANAVQGVAEFLRARGLASAPYHKNVAPETRLATLDAFARGDVKVLCCTDLAARGLDLPAVDHVIQFEFALNVVNHLHRVGRAARAGAPGKATNFHDDSNADLVNALHKSLDDSNTVRDAFSRRRGFRQKIKKQRRRLDDNNKKKNAEYSASD